VDFQLSDEQKKMIQMLDDLGKREFAPKAARWDKEHEYPWDNVHILRELGLMGMTIPKKYGGQERPLIDAILAIETAAKYCGVTGRILVESNMGALGAVMAYGTEAQCELVARRILEEGDKPAIGMTEPQAGTNLTELKTRADQTRDGYVINGRKHWITGGGISVSNLIFVRMFDEKGSELGIGGVLVDKGHPGFSFGRVEDAMGLRGIPETELIFENCLVPQENVVVTPDPEPSPNLEGFKKLMFGYNGQRTGASAVALGIAQGAHDLAVEYMTQRETFGKKLSQYQGLQWMVAEGQTELDAARLLIYRSACTARQLPNNVMMPHIKESSMAKAFTGHAALEVVSDSLQMFGAAGYSKDLPLERMMRDVRMFQIGGGTTQAQLTQIARSVFKKHRK
jgi:alkylation response protein AidB-like acyl-CoA dehydrogenase